MMEPITDELLLQNKQRYSKEPFPHPGEVVYLLFQGDEPVYVGRTILLIERLGNHVRRGLQFDSFSFVRSEVNDLYRIENSLIWKLRPRHNRTYCFNHVDDRLVLAVTLNANSPHCPVAQRRHYHFEASGRLIFG